MFRTMIKAPAAKAESGVEAASTGPIKVESDTPLNMSTEAAVPLSAHDCDDEPAEPCDDAPSLQYGAMVIPIPSIETFPHIQEVVKDNVVLGYNIHITGGIGVWNQATAMALSNVVQILDHATEDMVITFYLDTPGGRIDNMARIVSAMRTTKAKTVTVAVGAVMSAGGPIWAAGKVRKILPGAVFMFHFSSHGDFGNSMMIAQNADRLVQYVKDVFLGPLVADGLLLEEELARVLQREDVLVSASVMQLRLNKKLETA